MIEPNILAFQNADILEALSDTTTPWTKKRLADHVGRDDSNLGKTLRKMVDEGLLRPDPLDGPTDAGKDQLAAFRRAKHGGERRKAQGRWPLDRFRRNPLNRAIDPEAVLGLADTIVGVGDILMPLVVSAPDADGVRTIWAGERRWMAATRLAQLDQLPEALLQGLPFTERAADKGEAAVITLIENGARADLTPWDDARQLRIAADETGLNATELARKIGRARDGDRGGVRDVQVKIKVAREATPDAIAAYEADPSAPGAWEALRDSVSKPKAAATPVENHAHAGAAQTAPQSEGSPLVGYTPGQPYRRRFDRHNPQLTIQSFAPDFDWSMPREDQLGALLDPTSRETFVLPHPTAAAARYANGYPRAQIEMARIAGSGGWVYAAGYSTSGVAHHERLDHVHPTKEAFADRETALAAGVDLIVDSLGRMTKFKLPADIAAWLANPRPAGPFVVNGVDYLNAARAGEARRALGLERNHANYGGGERRALAEAVPEDAGPTDQDPQRVAEDSFGRFEDEAAGREDAVQRAETEVRERAERTLADVRAFAEEDGLAQPFGGWRFRQLLSALSTAAPFVGAANGGSDDPDEAGCIFDANDCVIAVVDVHGEGPDAEADAQAELIAYALNFACSMGAQGVGTRTLDWPTAPEGETTEATLIRTGRLLEKIVGGAHTVTGDEALAAETLRQFGRALRDLETRLAVKAEAA